MRTRNKIALGIAAAALAALVIWALRPQPALVETAKVARGPFEQTVSDDGKTLTSVFSPQGTSEKTTAVYDRQ